VFKSGETSPRVHVRPSNRSEKRNRVSQVVPDAADKLRGRQTSHRRYPRAGDAGWYGSRAERVVSKAIDEAFASCGAKSGEMLTSEQRRNLFRITAQKVTPFVLHQMRGQHVIASIRGNIGAEGIPSKDASKRINREPD
jgi:hypothetical protein